MGIESVGVMSALSTAMTAMAIFLAMISGAVIGKLVFSEIRKRSAASFLLTASKKDRLLLLAKTGVRPFIPISRWALSKSRALAECVESAMMVLSEREIDVTAEALLSTMIAASILSFLIGWFFGGSPTFGIALGCIVFIGAASFARNRFNKRNIEMREEIPEALRTLAMSFRSGHSLPQVLSDSSRDCKGYLGHLFSVASDRIEMGATPAEALSVMKGNPRAPELSFVAVALDIQHQSGGSIALVLESAMESIEGELKLGRSLRVQTAQARLSASIVTIMPFVLIALFSLFSPDFLAPFFSSILGMAVLSIALVMQLTGILLVRRILSAGSG